MGSCRSPAAVTRVVMACVGAAALLAAAATAAPGCTRGRQKKFPRPGVLAVTEHDGATTFVRNFNPLLEVGNVRWPTRRAMYEPLLIHNTMTAEYVPWLARSYAWNDDRTRLRFAIRPGVRWSDGRPLRARDVVFTFELLARHRALDLRDVWAHLSQVRPAPDDPEGAVELLLARPHVPALEDLAQQPIVPEHVWAQVRDPVTFANEKPVATGPFTEVRWFRPQSYEIGKNPHYWQPGKPAFDALLFRAYPANEQTTLALLSGELDWAGEFLPAIDRLYVARDPAHHRYWFPPIDATVFLYANTARAPFDDVRVRKALSMALDRALMVKVAMHGYTRPADATGLADAHARLRDPAAVARGADWIKHDPARAAALLDQAGLRRGPDGLRRTAAGALISHVVQVPAGFSDWVAAAQIIVRGLRVLGIDAQVKASEMQTWLERLQSGDYGLAIGWSPLHATPWGFYRNMMSTHTLRPLGARAAENWHRFALPAADQLLAALQATADAGEQRRFTAGLEMLFAENAPAIPLFLGPMFAEFNTRRFSGFPDERHPYAPPSPHLEPQPLLVLTRLVPR